MKQETIQIIFLILIFIFIILLLFVIMFLVKNKDLIKNDPITYGINKYNFSYCTCMRDNQLITFPTDLKGDEKWGNAK